uniref:Uncharacterized protein n=1 Tax=Chromera velia CCMP2878 TaxID=1169474 RepID=A0A0G4IFX4_9ALVE|mmetsp:Transcript_43684/g.86166  ORF Transcript_43684/g.86166 Transcript_43684/m.86166 type:complete len:204 (-) Transcript_43684:108-719(-)|eukprot:Cvel_14059.t1-p1 / transcript=Cvel_14059.t1 / gene=Cvel_14059 / organism=Chromera_velia_CCMP2878 / gene_product=hypothetical protein / transcript_product=hypothetical protein / location=Cvel_scaffold986:23626-26175(-) / protein_length=203 / sequence_SO=supercontig / SO=protein_coding / is_pseudo=false
MNRRLLDRLCRVVSGLEPTGSQRSLTSHTARASISSVFFRCGGAQATSERRFAAGVKLPRNQPPPIGGTSADTRESQQKGGQTGGKQKRAKKSEEEKKKEFMEFSVEEAMEKLKVAERRKQVDTSRWKSHDDLIAWYRKEKEKAWDHQQNLAARRKERAFLADRIKQGKTDGFPDGFDLKTASVQERAKLYRALKGQKGQPPD